MAPPIKTNSVFKTIFQNLNPIEVGVTGAQIDENGDLIISYSDGTSQNIGHVVGTDGLTPYIGDNGNWWIGDTDTEVSAIGSDRSFTFTQAVASAVWEIDHNMGKYPSVSVCDSAGTVVFGSVTYIDNNRLTITFSAPFSGKAYLN